MSKTARIIFMGTPAFALPTLEALVGRCTVVGVITQPDRPAGRGRSLQPSPVKQLALKHALPMYQPENLRSPKVVTHVRAWEPDVIVTVATGHILTAEVLALPTRGTLNVHASLLPRWRGAAPIQHALLAGDTQTGVTIMCTDEGLDTGPILNQRAIPIGARETAASLHDTLAQLGADLLLETLPRWLAGELEPCPQASQGVTVADRIQKEQGLIDWRRPALEIDRQVRAFTPWPGTHTFWGKQRVIIIAAHPVPSSTARGLNHESHLPGEVMSVAEHPAVVTGEGLLCLDRLQLAGKRALPGPEFLRGRRDFLGAGLGIRRS